MGRKIKSRNKFCFASEFQAARHMAGFSLAAAAKMCCRDVRTIKNWESGTQPCPAWALRLMVLESRYMDALYGLQHDRAIKWAIDATQGHYVANDAIYSTQLPLKLVS